MTESPWYTTYFDDHYIRLQELYSPPEKSRQEAEAMVQLLDLEPGSRILDLCCGYGRIAIELVRLGYDVTGFDLSELALQRAQVECNAAGLSANWVQGDMRQLPFDSHFDAVINVNNSFGYFSSDKDDEQVIRAVQRSLKPEGIFLHQLNNAYAYTRNFHTVVSDLLPDDLFVVQEHDFDAENGRVHTCVTMMYRDGTRASGRYSMRVYSPPEMRRMLRKANMQSIHMFGSLDGSPLSIDSVLLVALSRKSTSLQGKPDHQEG